MNRIVVDIFTEIRKNKEGRWRWFIDIKIFLQVRMLRCFIKLIRADVYHSASEHSVLLMQNY
jgi:hypothetical protein